MTPASLSLLDEEEENAHYDDDAGDDGANDDDAGDDDAGDDDDSDKVKPGLSGLFPQEVPSALLLSSGILRENKLFR